MDMERILSTPRLAKAATGLTAEEFETLARGFASLWQKPLRHRRAEGTSRQRQPGGGRKGQLAGPRHSECLPRRSRHQKEARETAVEALRKRMRGLITELTQLLAGGDARWRAFGLNPPDTTGIPEVPEGLTLIGADLGHLLARWETAPLAARYRVFKKVVGVDNEFVFAATVTETDANLNTFTPGVAVRVTAVNDAGESLPSDSVEQVVP